MLSHIRKQQFLKEYVALQQAVDFAVPNENPATKDLALDFEAAPS